MVSAWYGFSELLKSHVRAVKFLIKKNDPIEIGGVSVDPGQRRTIDLGVGQLYSHNPITMPVHVVNGRRQGPRLFVSAAVHGDELNGIEIIRRLLAQSSLKKLHGTLLAVPIVNTLGVLHQSRYLPDRRDLNRSFPGSETGSLTARVANVFMKEIVERATHGIDLHTGAIHRSNLPQIRAMLDDEETLRLAKAFGAPVILHSNLKDGSLRQIASDRGIPMLLFEGGEALRFDELSIRAGLRGLLRVMRELEMLPRGKRTAASSDPIVARSSSWVRAPVSGIFRMMVRLGELVDKSQRLGAISNPFGGAEEDVLAPFSGLVIGRSNIPLTHEGDALFHLARLGAGVSASDIDELADLADEAGAAYYDSGTV